MAQFVVVPPQRLPQDSLSGLLEEYASRDGTDYGEKEFTLEQKVGQLRLQLHRGELQILYDVDSEQWDLLPADQAAPLLNL